MVKKVITNLDSSKASGPNCIAVVVITSCGTELSYILAKLFNVFNVFERVLFSRLLEGLIGGPCV